MTERKENKLSGRIPLPPREVSSTPYVVQQGDTMQSITGRFTHPSKWPGLVGANARHKELADADGEHFAVFKDLKVGEQLLIPAGWTQRGDVGAPGQVDGCQTYGMDQFGGVAGFARMTGRRPQIYQAEEADYGRERSMPAVEQSPRLPDSVPFPSVEHPGSSAHWWNSPHPGFSMSYLSYWSIRMDGYIRAIQARNPALLPLIEKFAPGMSTYQGLINKFLPHRFDSPQAMLAACQQFVQQWGLASIPYIDMAHGYAYRVPGYAYADDMDAQTAAVAAAQYFQGWLSNFQGQVGAPGQVDGCQTYGMDQFGGVAGFARMTSSRPLLQAAPKDRRLVARMTPWDHQHAQGGTNLDYWADRIEKYAKYVIEHGLQDGFPAAGLFLNVMNDPNVRTKVEAFLRHYDDPANFEYYMAREGTSGDPTPDGGTVQPSPQGEQLPRIDNGFGVPNVAYADSNDARHAAIGAFVMLPEWWIMPGGGSSQQASGNVQGPATLSPLAPPMFGGSSNVSIQDPIVGFFNANWLNVILPAIQGGAPNWEVPVGPGGQAYTPADIAKVVGGFLPYLAKMPSGSLPPNISVPPLPLPANPLQWGGVDFIAAMGKSAAELLGATQAKNGDLLASVPWDAVPWHSFPWPAVTSFDNCWGFFQGSMQRTGALQRPAPMPSKSVSAMPENYTPGFLTENWSEGPWGDVPWNQINWSTVDPSILENDKIQACLKEPGAQARLQQMLAHQDCFIGKGPEVFARYLCMQDGAYLPLDDCKGVLPPLPQGCPPNTFPDPNGACVPMGTGPVPKCAPGYQGFPAPNLPQGIACCADGSVYDLTTGMCLTPGGQPVPPANTITKTDTKDEGLSTGEKVAIGVGSVGLLGLVYALWSRG
jgi:hypothetical protein